MSKAAKEVRVRIAPSPTGNLHIGNARAGLFNYLFARSVGGKFILRVDDTDKERSTLDAEDAIYKGFEWLGIDWDEGPNKDGGYGPYRQSERSKLYADALNKMLEDGNAYYCFCSQDVLAEKRTDAEKAHEIYRYDEACRDIPLDEARKRVAAGERAVVRLKIPRDLSIVFTDLVRGEIVVNSSAFDDFVIAKPGGDPLYNFATVVDDHLMDISHVLRGQDHLTNTSKQILIYHALGYDLPEFGHLPLILDTKRKKLSKRAGAVYIGDFQEQGFLPEAVTNFIALLGWAPGDNREKMTLSEMVDAFKLERVQKSDAIFDMEKLMWLNGVYIREMDIPTLTSNLKPYLKNAGLVDDSTNEKWLESVMVLEQERIRMFSEAPEMFEFFFKDIEYSPKLLQVKQKEDSEISKALSRVKETLNLVDEWKASEIENSCRALVSEMGWKAGRLIHANSNCCYGKKSHPTTV